MNKSDRILIVWAVVTAITAALYFSVMAHAEGSKSPSRYNYNAKNCTPYAYSQMSSKNGGSHISVLYRGDCSEKTEIHRDAVSTLVPSDMEIIPTETSTFVVVVDVLPTDTPTVEISSTPFDPTVTPDASVTPTPTNTPAVTPEPTKHCNNGEGNLSEECSPAKSPNANNDENNTTPKQDKSH